MTQLKKRKILIGMFKINTNFLKQNDELILEKLPFYQKISVMIINSVFNKYILPLQAILWMN